MKEEDKSKIEEFIRLMQCPKGFKCLNCRFDNLYVAKDIGLNYYLECIKDNPTECPSAFPIGDSYLCHCPVRLYFAKKLKK
jgi:hypothetical protein